jgi:hypothetical protein
MEPEKVDRLCKSLMEIAERMSVQIRDRVKVRTRRGAYALSKTSHPISSGPTGEMWAGHGIVLLEENSLWQAVEQGEWAYVLHEISHAVWTPADLCPNEVKWPETEGQDQWEYAVVRTLFPRWCWTDHVEFLNQSNRTVGRDRMDISATDQYVDSRRLISWKRGIQVAISAGALESSRVPTWRPPNFEVLQAMNFP